MAKEPMLIFRLSKPEYFKCSLCKEGTTQGMFGTLEPVSRLIDDFREHVAAFHPAGEDFSQAAVRIVREATDG